MPRPKTDLHAKVRDLLGNVASLPEEAARPHAHYRRVGSDRWNLLVYADNKFRASPHYGNPAAQHLNRLRRMIVVDLIENFERFLKELAALCVDAVGPYVIDRRFHVLGERHVIGADHFTADRLGLALCEQLT